MLLEVGVGRYGIVVYTQLQEVRGQVARVEPSSEVPGGMEQAANWYCKCCVVCCRVSELCVMSDGDLDCMCVLACSPELCFLEFRILQ